MQRMAIGADHSVWYCTTLTWMCMVLSSRRSGVIRRGVTRSGRAAYVGRGHVRRSPVVQPATRHPPAVTGILQLPSCHQYSWSVSGGHSHCPQPLLQQRTYPSMLSAAVPSAFPRDVILSTMSAAARQVQVSYIMITMKSMAMP